MVMRILLSRPQMGVSHRRRLERDLKGLDELLMALKSLIQEDSRCYLKFVQASRKMPGIEEDRARRSGRRLRAPLSQSPARAQAIQTPVEICRMVIRVLEKMKGVVSFAGPLLGSDLKAGQALLRGAFEAASMMTEVNLRGSGSRSIDGKARRDLAVLRKALNA
jgi:formiminotetrahydrofolate cyclodeaminase